MKVMDVEIEDIERNNTLELVDLPEKHKIIVFTYTINCIFKYISKLYCILGYIQS